MTVASITELAGLDGQNPLGYLAALGLLRVLDEHARASGLDRPRLAFAPGGVWHARLWTPLSYERIRDVILEDAVAQATSTALGLAYDKNGLLCSPDSPGATQDLKPPPAAARDFLFACARARRRDADMAAAFFSELVQDRGGNNTKPTALHFTAGTQTFLAMVESLRKGITAKDVDEALVGPWLGVSKLPSLSWDATATRNYALRASNPSGETRGSVAAANWLAVHALPLHPVTPRRGKLRTAGFVGGWKGSTFAWPLWTVPAGIASVAALSRLDARSLTGAARRALGIELVLVSEVLRSDQGGYGSFTPADVVV